MATLSGSDAIPEASAVATADAGEAAVAVEAVEAKKGRRARPRVSEGLERAGEGAALPQKRYFRSRAHINPLNKTPDGCDFPANPDAYDWAKHFPAFADPADPEHRRLLPGKAVDVADIGCGFGGLLTGLSPLLPESLVVGMEIRPKVSEYVRLRILATRNLEAGALTNASVVNTNTMKYLLHFFKRGQMSKLFFCFPDPHFKRANHRRRIVSVPLLEEYAFVLRPGGLLYHITDVLDLHNWMAAHCLAHPMFERLSDAELAADPCVEVMRTYTEEGKKVERLQKNKYYAVFRRLPDAPAPPLESAAASFWTSEPRPEYTWIPDKAQLKAMEGFGSRKRRRAEEKAREAAGGGTSGGAAGAPAAEAASGGGADDGAGAGGDDDEEDDEKEDGEEGGEDA